MQHQKRNSIKKQTNYTCLRSRHVGYTAVTCAVGKCVSPTVHACVPYCACMCPLLCMHVSPTVHACVPYCACMCPLLCPLLCMHVSPTVHACVPYCACMCPLLCMHVSPTVHACVPYCACMCPLLCMHVSPLCIGLDEPYLELLLMANANQYYNTCGKLLSNFSFNA